MRVKIGRCVVIIIIKIHQSSHRLLNITFNNISSFTVRKIKKKTKTRTAKQFQSGSTLFAVIVVNIPHYQSDDMTATHSHKTVSGIVNRTVSISTLK